MIDTLRNQFPEPRPLHESSYVTRNRCKEDTHREWTAFYSYIKANGHGRHGLVLLHKPTGLRIMCHYNAVVAVEVSLPRLLFRDNSSVLTSQDEIDESLRAMEGLIGRWASGNTGPREFIRIDMMIQFFIQDHPAAALIQTIATMRHPDCRTRQREWFFNRSINACYHESGDMIIKAYDKGLERQVKRRISPRNRHVTNVVRIEISLTGTSVKSRLGNGEEYPDHLDFDDCYQAYRRILMDFGPIPCSNTRPRKVRQFLIDLLARASSQGFLMEDGRTVLDHLRECSDQPVTIRPYERKIAGRNLAAMNLNWEELFPEQWPPPHLALSLNQQFGPSVTRHRRRQENADNQAAANGG